MAFGFLFCWLLFPLIIAVVLGGVLASAADQTTKLGAGGRVQNIALHVASLFDGSSATLSQIDIDDSVLTSCLIETISLLNETIPGGLAAPFLFLEEEEARFCSLGSNSNCEFAVTAFFGAAEGNCADVNGKLLTEDLYLCNEEFGTTDDFNSAPDINVKLSNIPVCVDQTCPEDTTYQQLLRRLLDFAPDGDDSLESAFTGQCAPTEIEWRIPSTRYENRSGKVGNTIVFNYGSFHNVYIHPSGGCDESGRVLVGATGGPASYTFATDDAGKTITFACDIGQHCEAGQIISFQVEEVPTGAPTSVSPITMAPTAAPDGPSSMPISPSNAPYTFPIRKTPGSNGKEGLKMKRFTSSVEPTTTVGIRGSNRRTLSKQYPQETKPIK